MTDKRKDRVGDAHPAPVKPAAALDPPMHAHVPMDMHPGILGVPGISNPDHAPTGLPEAAAALKEVYAAWAQLHDARQKILNGIPDRSNSLGLAREKLPAEFVKQVDRIEAQMHQARMESHILKFEAEHGQLVDAIDRKVSKRLENAWKRVSEDAALLDIDIDNTIFEHRPEDSIASEIRAHVRGLAPKDRLDFVTNAGPKTVAAVLMSADSPYLAGFDADGMARLRTWAEQNLAPKAFARREATQKLNRIMSNAFTAWAGHVRTQRSSEESPTNKVRRRLRELAAGFDPDAALKREAGL